MAMRFVDARIDPRNSSSYSSGGRLAFSEVASLASVRVSVLCTGGVSRDEVTGVLALLEVALVVYSAATQARLPCCRVAAATLASELVARGNISRFSSLLFSASLLQPRDAMQLARQQLAQQQQLAQARGMVTMRSKDPGDMKRKERRDKRRRTSQEFKQPLQKMTMQVMSNGATVQVPNMHPEAFPVWRLRTDTANGAAWMSPRAREEQLRAAEERRREQAEKRKRRG
ncbi:Hypothetical Protein FCC1311_011792 [Hondaea fermentalgiana]|uniref:Uncharacterized protein n=1 Tax=Hondaea fermentalgiana TaxID=2315210 RepID=A0A2R5G1U6_9STRA|nr:Hypothetical Protein FCC1311_011792 [Hondaea fermentalgiana]|eukprot:GBG24962.1 Hypothetical Protein FCC1311_011792 [Hondaea fermentalgiana]